MFERVQVKIARVDPSVILPQYESEHAGCFDLRPYSYIPPGKQAVKRGESGMLLGGGCSIQGLAGGGNKNRSRPIWLLEAGCQLFRQGRGLLRNAP